MAFTTHTIISKDGTHIGYRQVGAGARGLIICHGAGRISQNYEKLALALAGSFTVYIPDRRGRGLSGPAGKGYDIHKAVEDLVAVIEHTGAAFIFAHSAGSLIALEAMRTHPVSRLAVYDPPVSVDHSMPLGWLPAFEEALRNGRRKKAMAISLKGLGAIKELEKMPLGVFMLLVNMISLFEQKKAKGTRMLDLLSTLPADIRMVQALDSTYGRYHDITIPVSLMAGANSQHYFRLGTTVLAGVLPQSVTTIFNGFDHYSPEEKVTEIAASLRSFFID